jgi:ABC-type branched-subunit amino acid transport system substrate-binding protein
MKNSYRNGLGTCLTIASFCIMVLLLPLWSPNSFGVSDKPPLSSEEKLRLGERMYREGILSSGEPMKAVVKGDLPVPGTAFTCESCHLRSGLGSVEGGVITPPTNGAKLFKPFQRYSSPTIMGTPFRPSQVDQQNQKFYQIPPNRPVYTDESLAHALQGGIDPAGRILNDVMPRYHLEDEEMQILVSYLKELSSKFSPGVSDTTIRFATIITDDVSPEEQNAMLVPLENFIKSRNQTNFIDPRSNRGAWLKSAGVRSRLMADTTLASLGVGLRKLSLSRWVLKGPPETWRSQLEEYYRKEPVFALMGGITNGEWQPIHQFCEENRIPSIFPITNYPVISQTDWYTLYLSKGFYQEGEGAARFLNSKDELKDKPIVQIVRDTREGRTLSRGFQETWRELENKAPVTVILKAGEALTNELLQKELAQTKPAAIMLWDGPESLKTLDLLAAGKNGPVMVLVSSSYLGKSMLSLNEQVRDFTYMTYPYGISQTPQEKSATSMGIKSFSTEANMVATTRISQQSLILTMILNMAIQDMKGNYYRDNFLDVTGMIMDQDVPLYERLSFGPGQRYASKGCYIVQLGKGPKPKLVKKSDWVIH